MRWRGKRAQLARFPLPIPKLHWMWAFFFGSKLVRLFSQLQQTTRTVVRSHGRQRLWLALEKRNFLMALGGKFFLFFSPPPLLLALRFSCRSVELSIINRTRQFRFVFVSFSSSRTAQPVCQWGNWEQSTIDLTCNVISKRKKGKKRYFSSFRLKYIGVVHWLSFGPLNRVDTMPGLRVVGYLLYDSRSKRKRGRG